MNDQIVGPLGVWHQSNVVYDYIILFWCKVLLGQLASIPTNNQLVILQIISACSFVWDKDVYLQQQYIQPSTLIIDTGLGR